MARAGRAKQRVVCLDNDGYSASLARKALSEDPGIQSRKAWTLADHRRVRRGLSLSRSHVSDGRQEHVMKLIDLSREIYHKMPRLPKHPPIIITTYGTHDEIRDADGYKFSTATMSLALGDHSGTPRRCAGAFSMPNPAPRPSTSSRWKTSFSTPSASISRTSRSNPTSRST